MPKAPLSKAASIREWISGYPEGVFSTEGKVIFCQACQCEVHLINLFKNNNKQNRSRQKKSFL
jgi:hypothetical protein